MIRQLFLSIVLLGISNGTAQKGNGQTGSSKLKGRVLTETQQNGLGGVEVAIEGGNFDRTLTSGHFSIPLSPSDRPGDTATLTVTKKGWVVSDPEELNVTIPSNPNRMIKIHMREYPKAVPDTINTPANTPANINVLTNDVTVVSGALISTTRSTKGTVSITSINGDIRYTPQKGFSGTDVFNYTVRDKSGIPVTGTVNVIVAKPRVAAVRIESVDVDIYTEDDDKNKEEAVTFTIFQGREVRAEGVYYKDREIQWPKYDKRTAKITLRPQVPAYESGTLSIRVHKQPRKSETGKGWNMSIEVWGNLSNKQRIHLLPRTERVRIGAGNPIDVTWTFQSPTRRQ